MELSNPKRKNNSNIQEGTLKSQALKEFLYFSLFFKKINLSYLFYCF